MDNEQLVTLTADIVSAHVENNKVALSDVPLLLRNIHEALSGLGAAPVMPQAAKEPIVSVRSSVKPEQLICLECGSKHRTLKRHLQRAHGLTPDQYRIDYKLGAEYPMVAPEYAEKRRQIAKASGLGRGGRPRAAATEGS